MVKLTLDYFKDILKNFMPLFVAAIELEFQLGNSISVENAKDQGKKTTLNPLNVTQKDIDLWTQKIELNIKDANMELSKQISNSILDNIANKGTNADLTKILRDLFSDTDKTNKRYKTIARNESSEILNTSGRNTALKLGNETKWISTIFDNRRCPICNTSEKKYGNESKAIPIDKEFVVHVNGKEFRSINAKLHIQCRCITLYGFL